MLTVVPFLTRKFTCKCNGSPFGSGRIPSTGLAVGVGNGSHDNLFIDNEVLDSTAGFYVVDGHHNEFKSNSASGNETGFQFHFASQNTLKGNTAHGNSQSGFSLCDSSTENGEGQQRFRQR